MNGIPPAGPAAHATVQPDARAVASGAERAGAIVIGAGPAGSVAAALLAREGIRTVLLERAHFPRAKVCGCCLGARGVSALERCGLGDALDGASALVSASLAHGRHWVDVPLGGSRVIARDVLDARLAESAARAGCDVRMGVRASVVGLGHASDPAIVQADDVASAASRTLHADLVVCADGLGGKSIAAHGTGDVWAVDPASRFGVASTLKPDALDIPASHLWMMSRHDGYVGAVRLPSGEIDVAAAIDPAAARRCGGPDALITAIVESCGRQLRDRLPRVWRGTPALTRRRAWIGRGRVICVGDAAGYVEPFTGEGMSWAIEGAVAAASAAPRIISLGDSGEWDQALASVIGTHQRRCRHVATMLRFPRATMCALRAASRIPALRRRIGALATGAA
jgi:flavin-dependent dehydrogenase